MSLTPVFSDDLVTLYLGDCLDVLRDMPADSIDAIVTDPPAGIAFMGREWDDFRRARNPADAGRDNVFGRTSARGPEYGRRDRGQFVDWLTERLEQAYRVLKPGGHLLVWSIPRTSHWTAWAVEDAGLEIRDCILHLFGSGFPKSLDVSKAIDKTAGAEREVIGRKGGRYEYGFTDAARDHFRGMGDATGFTGDPSKIGDVTAPATENAARWEGWGTALKPGQEMWWLARKPLKGTVAASVLEFGTGALNIDGCKVASHGEPVQCQRANRTANFTTPTEDDYRPREYTTDGRWPANVVFTHSASCDGVCAPDCPAGELDRQSGSTPSSARVDKGILHGSIYGGGKGPSGPGGPRGHADSGGASRFYPVFRYQAKAPASERPRLDDGTAHETVKPLGLMTWLVRLITPPGGTVLDLFAGSGPVAEACIIEGFRCVLIEQDPKSAELIRKRLSKPIQPIMSGGLA